jgi:hypothetical protein
MVDMCRAGLASNAAYFRLQGKNADGTDSPGLPNYLDVENFADYMILNLYCGNRDWPHRNYWVGRDRETSISTGFKFYMWDAEWIIGINSDLSTNRLGVDNGVAAPWPYLRQNAEFRLLVADRLHRHFFSGGPLYVDPLAPQWDPAHPERNVPAARFKELADRVDRAVVPESARWGDQHTSTSYTRDEHWEPQLQSVLNQYFPQRSAIVLEQFRQAGLYPQVEAPSFNQHGGSIREGFVLRMYAPAGTIHYTLDGTDPRRVGGALSPAANAQTGDAVVLDETTHVKARTRLDGEWSALTEAIFTVPSPLDALRITEIMYHPREYGLVDGDAYEFIELKNTGTELLDLVGVSFSEGIGFTFPEGTMLPPGAFAVLAANEEAFRDRYPGRASERIAGVYTGNLSNNGETVALRDPTGMLIARITFDDRRIRPLPGAGGCRGERRPEPLLVVAREFPCRRLAGRRRSHRSAPWGLATRRGSQSGRQPPAFGRRRDPGSPVRTRGVSAAVRRRGEERCGQPHPPRHERR